jgi:Uncharacterized conserved protein (DUF2285)
MHKHTIQPSATDTAPTENWVTDYDRTHLTNYLRLLAAAKEGAPWAELARVVPGIDSRWEPDQAKKVYDSHLARARWMTDHGYRDVLRGAAH